MTTPINHPHWQEDPWEIKLSDAPIIGRDGYQYSADDPDKTSDGQDLRDDFGWGLVEAIGNLLEAIATPIGEILSGIGDFVGTAFHAVVDGVGNLLEGIVGFIGYAFDRLFGRGSVEVGPRWSPFKDDIDSKLAPLQEILDANFAEIDTLLDEYEAVVAEQEDQIEKLGELEIETDRAIEAAEQVTTNLANYRTELLEAIGPELDRAKNELEEAKAGLVTREELTGELETVGENQEGLFLEMAEASFENFDGTFQDFITLWRDQQIKWNETQQIVNDKQGEWNKAANDVDAAQTAAIDAQTRILNMVFPAQSAVPLIPGELTPEWYDKAINWGLTPYAPAPPGAKDKEHFVEATGQFTTWKEPEHYVKVVPGQRYRATMWVRSSSSASNAKVDVQMRGLNSDGTVDNAPVWKMVQVLPDYIVGGYGLEKENVRASSSGGFNVLGFDYLGLSTGWRQLEVWVYFKGSVEQVAVRRLIPNVNGTSYTMRIGDLQIWPDLPAQTKVDEGQNAAMRALEDQIEGINDYLGKGLSQSQRVGTILGRFDENDEALKEMSEEISEFIPRLFYGTPGHNLATMGSELLTVSSPSSNTIRVRGKKTATGDSWVGKGVVFWYAGSSSAMSMKETSFRSDANSDFELNLWRDSGDRGPIFIAWQMTKGRRVVRNLTFSGGTLNNSRNGTILGSMTIPSNAEIQSVTTSYWLDNAHNGTEYAVGYIYGSGGGPYHATTNIGPLTPFGDGRRLMEASFGPRPNNGGTTINLIGYGLNSGTSQRRWSDGRLGVVYVVPA